METKLIKHGDKDFYLIKMLKQLLEYQIDSRKLRFTQASQKTKPSTSPDLIYKRFVKNKHVTNTI